MRKLIGTLAGAALALGLFAGRARAGETVFTDEGWYRVEGNAPTPQPDQNADALQTTPAMPVANAPAAQPSMPVPPPPMNAPFASPRSCIDERGALARRLLTLHGLEVGKADLTDAQLGALGVASQGAALPFSASLSVDPDLNLLVGNLPIPPSSANWDEETRQDWQALVDCESD